MSAMGQTEKFGHPWDMSVRPPAADIVTLHVQVRSVPLADINHRTIHVRSKLRTRHSGDPADKTEAHGLTSGSRLSLDFALLTVPHTTKANIKPAPITAVIAIHIIQVRGCILIT